MCTGDRPERRLGVWKSVGRSLSGVQGKAPAANTFSAYFRPQNVTRRKNKFSFLVKFSSMNYWSNNFVLVQSYRGSCPACPPWICCADLNVRYTGESVCLQIRLCLLPTVGPCNLTMLEFLWRRCILSISVYMILLVLFDDIDVCGSVVA